MPAIKFCGASVTSFNTKLGWGSNKSSLDVSLVEDVRAGDFFNPPPLGTPAYFYFGPSFHFWGILSTWKKSDSTRGLGVYNVTVEDPRELLQGSAVILNNYNGSTYNVQNILNCYGYWENTGFGNSQVNDGGMPWYKVLSAIQTLTNNPLSTFGGPLHYRGIDYAVDLSNLPIPPTYYRVGAGSTQVYLIELIQQICDDNGCDFFVELDPGTVVPIIRVFVVNRYLQPPLGSITQITTQNWGGTVVSGESGIELRNAPNTKFVIGGSKCDLYQTDALTPFWGLDNNGIAIDDMVVGIPGLGVNGTLGYCHAANVNAQEIAGCLQDGSSTYFLTEYEMRAALASIDAWIMYVNYETAVLNNKKSINIGPLGLMGAFGPPANGNKQVQVLADFINALHNQGNTDAQEFQQNLVWQFVKNIADNWYGKQYWVSLPFVLNYVETDTGIPRQSHEIADAGWLPDGVTPFSLSPDQTVNFVNTNDFRYNPLAIYSVNSINLLRQPPQAVVQPDGLYTPISVDNKVRVMSNGLLAVVLTVDSPVEQISVDIFADASFLGVILQQQGNPRDGVWKAIQGNRAWGSLNIIIPPPRVSPTAVAIPLKSNVSCYGPWYYAGPAGRVEVVKAEDLTPWAYGSTYLMNLAAQSQTQAAITQMQVGETGKIELVGMPLTSLGQALVAGGPNCTNMEVQFGNQGITTTYNFRTFTDLHINRFASGALDRIKRIASYQMQIKRQLLDLQQKTQLQAKANVANIIGYIEKYPKWQIAWASPAPVIISTSISDQNRVRVNSALCDPTEGWTGIGGSPRNDNVVFQNSALCSLSAIMRAFDNNSTGSSAYLPKIEQPLAGIAGLTNSFLNPFTQGHNDFEYLSAGTTTQNGGYVVANDNIDWNNVRGIAITMPMMCAGWGWDINGNFVPNPLTPDKYKVGPLDPLWDTNRKVWSVHDMIFGTLTGDCASNGSATITIQDGGGATLTVNNFFSATVKANTKVVAGYIPYSNKWILIAADCTS